MEELLKEFKNKMRLDGKADKTIRTYTASMKEYFKWFMVQSGFITFISINLSNVRELPTIIVQRLETLINQMIADHEQKYNVTIPMDNAELGIYMDIDTQEHTLSLDAYVGYDLEKECITGKEVMTAADEDYSIIKK